MAKKQWTYNDLVAAYAERKAEFLRSGAGRDVSPEEVARAAKAHEPLVCKQAFKIFNQTFQPGDALPDFGDYQNTDFFAKLTGGGGAEGRILFTSGAGQKITTPAGWESMQRGQVFKKFEQAYRAGMALINVKRSEYEKNHAQLVALQQAVKNKENQTRESQESMQALVDRLAADAFK